LPSHTISPVTVVPDIIWLVPANSAAWFLDSFELNIGSGFAKRKDNIPVYTFDNGVGNRNDAYS